MKLELLTVEPVKGKICGMADCHPDYTCSPDCEPSLCWPSNISTCTPNTCSPDRY